MKKVMLFWCCLLAAVNGWAASQFKLLVLAAKFRGICAIEALLIFVSRGYRTGQASARAFQFAK